MFKVLKYVSYSLLFIFLTEKVFPYEKITQTITEAHGPSITREDVLLTSSGTNPFYSLFREASREAREEKRGIWIQLGWLYIDTAEVMKLLTSKDDTVLTLDSPQDFSKLEKIFRKHGSKIAGIVTEFPTNPL